MPLPVCLPGMEESGWNMEENNMAGLARRIRGLALAGSLAGGCWFSPSLAAEEPQAELDSSPAKVAASPTEETTTPVSTTPLTPGIERLLAARGDKLELDSLLKDSALSGWKVLDGKRDAWVSNGNMVSCVKPGGGWLCTDEVYGDFVCRFEYRLTAGANTGISFRCSDVGSPSSTGYEIQLLDDSSEKYAKLRPEQYTGSLYYKRPPLRKATSRPLGEWNEAEIVCLGGELRVTLNGELVNEVNLAEITPLIQRASAQQPSGLSPLKPTIGHVALQGYSSRIDFRNIRLHDLAQRTDSGVRYVDLEEGTGAVVSSEQVVKLHFVGLLPDGTRFTDSHSGDRPVTVSLEEVIPGWQAGIAGMKVGGRRKLIVPPEQAYGEEGVDDLIPANATLVFEVELLEIVE